VHIQHVAGRGNIGTKKTVCLDVVQHTVNRNPNFVFLLIVSVRDVKIFIEKSHSPAKLLDMEST
jgi:hypothetical protein